MDNFNWLLQGFAEAATVWQQLDNYVVFARLAQA